jgi:AraC-like DNA-binding protein
MNIPPTIADTLNIRCLLFSKIHFKPVHPDHQKWITQPFPVLAMLVSGNGKIVVPKSYKTSVIKDLWEPFYLPANMMRQPAATTDAGFEVLVLGFSVEVLGGIALLNSLHIPLMFSRESKDRLKRWLLEFHELKSMPAGIDLHQLAEQKRILFGIFGVLIKEAEPKQHDSLLNAEENGCLPAVQYLKENYASSFKMRDLWEMCHLSPTHFFRQFKSLTGLSPFLYLKDRRIEAAQKLLVSTRLSVMEIGEQVGWPDQFHFSRTFKSRTGHSPRQYREQYQPDA